MGLIEDIEALNLADDEKEKLRRSYGVEVAPLRERAEKAELRDRRTKVDTEIAQFSDLGFQDAPRALAFLRRVFLSPDANENDGAVLFSDLDLELSGDDATGAVSREPISVANALRTFINLLPRTEEGKLKIALSDQGVAAEAVGRREDGKEKTGKEKSSEHKESLGRVLGTSIDRPSRSKRYGGSHVGAN